MELLRSTLAAILDILLCWLSTGEDNRLFNQIPCNSCWFTVFKERKVLLVMDNYVVNY